jgi:UDP-N-acetylmuramoyl-tripeptide--D-alanyl-D-alanine ligase
MYNLSEIAECVNGKLCGNDRIVSNFSIDSRTILQDDVFFCIKGERYDGHDFIKDSLKKASCIVTAMDIKDINLDKKSYIKVDDTLQALQSVSKYVRNKSSAKFIAITGSNGKTTVKEMIAHILSDYKICFTQGNLNNHIGVPLTLLSMKQNEDYVIVEIGSNNLGEIEPLAKIVNPDVAAVTNIGYAHIEGFGNLQNTAKEKYSLFKHIKKDGYAVINNQDKFRKFLEKGNKVYFGEEKNFYNKLKKICRNLFYETNFLNIKRKNKNLHELKIKSSSVNIKLSLNGDHNYYNAACATAIALSLGIELNYIKKKLETFKSISSRLKLFKLDNDIQVIDDCYNANPNSFKAAILFLSTLDKKKLVLMGDMVELGKDTELFHLEIGRYAKAMGIDKFLSIGKNSKLASDVFGIEGHHFENAENLKSYLNNNIEPSSRILIKGSRSAKLEEYVEFLKTRRF